MTGHDLGGSHSTEFTFDATQVVKDLFDKGQWRAVQQVTFIPSAVFLGSPLRIEKIELVAS